MNQHHMKKIVFTIVTMIFAGCSVIGHMDTIEPTDSSGWVETQPPSSFKVYYHECEDFILTSY